MTIGKKLRGWRKVRGLTQTEAATAAGLSQSTWAELEVGDFTRIGLDVAQRVVDVTCGEIQLSDFPRPKGPKVRPVPAPESGDIEKSHARAS